MKKKLPLAKPVIDSFAGYAAINNIVLNYEKGQDWFVQNFFKLVIQYEETYHQVCFDYLNMDTLYMASYSCFQPESYVNWPVETYSVPVSQVKTGRFVEFVKEQIESGFYVMVFLNWRYLRKYGYDTNGFHEVFLYGYDDEKEEIYATGYLAGKPYGELVHSFHDMEEAYAHMDMFWKQEIADHVNRNIKKISLLKYKQDFRFAFSIGQFTKDLKRYLHLEETDWNVDLAITFTKSTKRLAYGNQLYEVLGKVFRKNCEAGENIDLTVPYAIYNHLEGMLYKIEYLMEKEYIRNSGEAEQYKAVVKSGKAFLFTAIKYIQQVTCGKKTDRNLGEKMQCQLLEMKEKEKAILYQIYKKLMYYN